MGKLPEPQPQWDGKYPVIGCRIFKDFPRPEPETVEMYQAFRVTDLSDLAGVLYTMDGALHPAYAPMKRIVGTALTVKCPPGDNMFVKYAIQYCKPGDVIVIDARGFMGWAVGGAANAQVARDKGCAGIVCDGGFRDINQLREADTPVILRGVAPATGPKRGPGELNVPVCCGGVIVFPGDIVVGDEEGTVVIPRQYARKIAELIKDKEQYADKANWDAVKMAERSQKREAYFNQILEARGCEFAEYADWNSQSLDNCKQ